MMSNTLNLNPEQERSFREAWGEGLDRAAAEALAIEWYGSGKLSAAQVGRLLGLGDRWSVNSWLAERRVPLNYTVEDFEADRRTLDRLLGKSG